ncbi:hypothetical protein [Sphingobacterium sp. LRF_L2]|uniref:hypothetical protein n=1 Tax=Sphingobacterium sp. LRF_L2 TaxID=3369421 RepID=UPI003F63F3EE
MDWNALFDGSGSWNKSLKCAALFYQWRLIADYDSTLDLLTKHQRWLKQAYFQNDNSYLPQLLEQWPKMDGKPRIWACFHIGPYALIARALLAQGCRLAILLREEVYAEQKGMYEMHFEKTFGRRPRMDELCFISAVGPTSMLKLRSAIQRGFHVVAYVDGRDGMHREGRGWTEVCLRGTAMDTRIGVAVLSKLTQTPIRPLVLTYETGRIVLHARGEILPSAANDYPLVLQHCYGLLERLHVDQLLQWECLPDLFDRLIASMEFDADREPIWMPADIPEKQLLFDIVSARSIRVSPESFNRIADLLKELLQTS